MSTNEALDLADFIDACPSPYHAVEEVALRLKRLGFVEHDEAASWGPDLGRGYLKRGGSILAWVRGMSETPHAGYRIAGAHTDSPNLRVKPQPDTGSVGVRQLGVEVYGGVLLNSWLDRDLGLSGRVYLRTDGAPEERLFRIDSAILRVPQLAIHLHRDIRTEGLKLNSQQHMSPIWGQGRKDERGFTDLLGETLDVDPGSILSWDAMTHDLTPSRLIGDDDVFLAAPRLDNLASCHGALRALERALSDGATNCILSFFDHEEVGSGSSRGAESPILRDLIERLVALAGGGTEDVLRALAGSRCVSMDMAHATHPNYVAKHEPDHRLHMNAGPVVKINANQRYATEGSSEAWFQAACEAVDVPYQRWVNRTDLACGSTIGPITAASLGVSTVDVGMAQLSMHSARELCGSHDPDLMIRAMASFFTNRLA